LRSRRFRWHRQKERVWTTVQRGMSIKAALAKFQAHIAAERRDYLHNLSRDLVNRFGRIAIEDLNVKGLAGGKATIHSKR
jgi:transposase